jgi:ferric enterobactin receptor
MRKVLRISFIGLLFCQSLNSFSQKADPDKILLNELYTGTLTAVLDSISQQTGIKITFDHSRFDKIRALISPSNESVSSVLGSLADEHRLRIYPGVDGSIYLVEKLQIETEDIEVSLELPKKDPSIRPQKFDFSIIGKVRDRITGEAIPYAILSIPGTKIITNSNVDGFFSILKTPTDTSTIIAYSVGYKKLAYYLNPSIIGKKLILDMTPEITNIGEVVVVSDKKDMILAAKEELSMIMLSPKKISELPNIGEKDVLRSFQLMPGVSANNESSSGLYVRGGTPDQNLILYDGFTVYYVDHLYGFYSAFNSNAIKDIKLYKGGFESKYGGRLSSVTDIIGKDGNQNEASGGGEISLLSMNGYLEIPIGKKFTSIFAVRRSYQGLLYDKIFKLFNKKSNNVPVPERRGPFAVSQDNTVTSYFYDLNGKFTYKPNEKDNISLSIYNGADNLDNSRESGGGPGGGPGGFGGFNANIKDISDFGNFGISTKWSRQWDKRIHTYALLGFSEYYSTRDRTNGTTFMRNDSTFNLRRGTLEDNVLKEFSFKTAATIQYNDRQKIETGIQLCKNLTSYNYGENDTSNILDRNDNGFLFSVYAQDKIDFLNHKISITPGFRSTWFNITKKLYIEPRISAGINLSENLKLSSSFGKYYQFVNRVMREDISSGNRDFWIMSDEKNVPVSYATHYITGIAYDFTNYLFSIEGYYKNLKGITEYTMRMVPASRQLNYEEDYYNGKGYAMGLEFLAQKKNGPLTGWVSYTLARSRNQFDVYGKNYFPSLQDVRHEFKAIGVYKFKRYIFSATWIYASGKPYTAPLGSYTLTLVDGNTQSFVGVGAKNAARFPAYHRLDLSGSINFRYLDRHHEGMVTFSLFNVYNHKNIWYKEYQIVEGVSVENNIKYLGITPNVTLSLKF